MDMMLRTATSAERLYAYQQCDQIANLCGSPGHMRLELDDIGTAYRSHWENSTPDQNTPKFKAEFDTVLDMLRFDKQYGQVLKNCTTMIDYCLAYPESRIGSTHAYVFRADTSGYSYLLRCTPTEFFDTVHIYSYSRNCLDQHMKQAEKGIRFITSDGKEKFRVPDGEHIRIITGGGDTRDRTARYIDESHVGLFHEWGSNVYHIRELAERLAQTGGTVIPMRSTLPDQCYCVLPGSDEIIIIKKGESGYYRTDLYGHDRADAISIVNECNGLGGVTKAQEQAMLAGSISGWDTPAADPKNYDEQGQPVKPKRHDRGDVR